MTSMIPRSAPVDMVMPRMAEVLMIYANWALVGVVLIAAVRYWRRTGSPVGMLLLLGGGLTVLNEPIVDVLGKCWFPTGSHVLFEAWGVSIPSFMLPVYAWYVGGQAFLAFRLFTHGLSARGFCGLYALYAIVNAALEIPGLNLPQPMYSYFGDQPFVIAKFPLWWVVVNALMPLAIGGIVFRLQATLHGCRRLIVIPLCLMTAAATNGAVAAPVWVALNITSASVRLTRCAALMSLCMVLLLGCGLSMLVAHGRRGDADG